MLYFLEFDDWWRTFRPKHVRFGTVSIRYNFSTSITSACSHSTRCAQNRSRGVRWRPYYVHSNHCKYHSTEISTTVPAPPLRTGRSKTNVFRFLFSQNPVLLIIPTQRCFNIVDSGIYLSHILSRCLQYWMINKRILFHCRLIHRNYKFFQFGIYGNSLKNLNLNIRWSHQKTWRPTRTRDNSNNSNVFSFESLTTR